MVEVYNVASVQEDRKWILGLYTAAERGELAP